MTTFNETLPFARPDQEPVAVISWSEIATDPDAATQRIDSANMFSAPELFVGQE